MQRESLAPFIPINYMSQISTSVKSVVRRYMMKKFKLSLAIICYVILILLIIIAITLPSIMTIYLSHKVLPVGIILIITILITNMVKELFGISKLKMKAKEKLRILTGKFDWKPSSSIKSNKPGKLIATYPKDYKFNFKSIEIENGKVEGAEAFKQSLIKFINTPKHKYKIYEKTNYGTEHNLFRSESTEEFIRQANNLAEQVIDYYGEWVERIYEIKMRNHYLIFELKVYGIPNTFSVTIPDLDYFSKQKRAKIK